MNIRYLLSSLSFLTILPIRTSSFEPEKMLPYFPVAGAIIGVFLAIFDLLLQKIFSIEIVSILDILFLTVITGAIHLDGLADTADGLFSHTDKERILEIMRDSRLGTMGAISLFFVLALKWVFVCKINPDIRFLGMISALSLSRGSMVIAAQTFKYCREKGLGKRFVKAFKYKDLLPFALITMLFFVLLKKQFLYTFFTFCAVLLVVLWFYKKKLNCITGDMLGALNELMETALFFSLTL